MESKALLAIALWFCVETRAASVGKEPIPEKEGGGAGAGGEMGLRRRPGAGPPSEAQSWRGESDLTLCVLAFTKEETGSVNSSRLSSEWWSSRAQCHESGLG